MIVAAIIGVQTLSVRWGPAYFDTTSKHQPSLRISARQKETSKNTQCLLNLSQNMPINNKGEMKAHHWDARTQKWNENDRWRPMTLRKPCTIWYVGANTQGADGVRLQRDYGCVLHAFEPVPQYAAELQKNWINVPRTTVHTYGIGARTRTVNGVKLAGQSTFAMNSTAKNGISLKIQNVADVWKRLNVEHIDLLHVNCEGCEWELWEALLSQNYTTHIGIVQIGTHWFPQINNIEQRYCDIERKMQLTHKTIFKQAFGWERWKLDRDKIQSPQVVLIAQLAFPTQISMLRYQVQNLRKMMPPFEYHVIAPFYSIPEDVGVQHHLCPFKPLAECMTFTFKHIVPKLRFAKVLVHLNVDMFLLKPWNAIAYMKRLNFPDIVSVIEDHSSVPGYFHPGFFVANVQQLCRLKPMDWQFFNGSDVGGKTYNWLRVHTHVRVKPMIWSRHFLLDTLVARGVMTPKTRKFLQRYKTVVSNGMEADVYTRDFAWLHMRDSTCWSACSDAHKQFIANDLPEFLAHMPYQNVQASALNDSDFACFGCGTTTTGRSPRISSTGWFRNAKSGKVISNLSLQFTRL